MNGLFKDISKDKEIDYGQVCVFVKVSGKF
jgi:hypothetical protein